MKNDCCRKNWSLVFPRDKKAQAILALAIFVFPSLAFSQGLKLDLLDGKDCRLYSDSTRQGLAVGRDSACWLPNPNYMRNYHDIDGENQLLSSRSYYFNNNELNQNGDYRIFELSDAALARSESRGRADWDNTKRASVGKSASALGKGGKGLLNFDIPVKFPKALTSLVGEGGPGLSVTGNYKVLFKLDKNYTTGVANLGVNRQGTPSFQTLQEYNMYITGNVGSKLFVNMKTDKSSNQYNQRLDLSDRIQIRYKGDEDDLVQTIEAGNTTLSLGGTRYAGFSQSVQGLFGVKAQGKLGGLNWTTIASQQKGSSQGKSFRAGAEATTVRIADKNYLRYTYFDLGKKGIAKPDSSGGMPPFVNEFDLDASGGRDTIEGDPVFFKAELYSNQTQNQLPYGRCFLNPLDTLDTVITNPRSEPVVEGFFLQIPRDQYLLNRDSFYVVFRYPLNAADKIGYMMQVRRGATGRLDTIGYAYWPLGADTTNFSAQRYVLKLLKRDAANPRNPSYYYEWKNVYDLREPNFDRDGFGAKIYEGDISEANDLSRKDYQGTPGAGGVRYTELLGLDQVNEQGQSPPDGKIDLNYDYSIVQEELGHIIFPDRYPFNPTKNFVGGTAGELKVKNPVIYNSDSAGVALGKYYLEIATKARRTEFSLGQVDILEGSEDVRLNGQKLIRDQDYRIDYQLGTITFYNSRVTDPNADVQVNYEYQPFLSSQKKNLFGLRTEYSTSEQFRLGSTVLYRNSSTIDQKPRIGEEPNHALLLDADFAYTGQSNFVTKLLDKLPLVTAVAPSAFQLDGEIARSMPNPNTLGRAYIDDFEGSRDFLSLGIRRTTWTKSSAPPVKNQANRGRLAWYVPDSKISDPRNNNLAVQRFRVLEIFPDRSVPSADERMDVLELRYFPKTDSTGSLDTTSWAGMMRWLGTGNQNHQETQLLEFWVGLEESTTAPRLRFDLGQISEDIDGDGGNPETEDPARVGTIRPEQDVGLDGIPDPDSSNDNWGISIDSINGTEKNNSDPEWLSKPDKEDLNDDGGLGGADSYFSFTVDLNDTTRFVVPGSSRYNDFNLNKDNQPEVRPGEQRAIRWRLIRVPLKDTSVAKIEGGSPSWSNIQFVRIWLEGADTSRLIFASLDLVGNRWKELGVFDDSLKPVTDSQKVRVSVINSQEHPAYRADPPPGVGEVLNKTTNLREREQSLVLTYENIAPQNQGLLQRVLLGGVEDYSGYRNLKMLVHGDRQIGNPADNLSDSLLFFLRFGSGTQNDPNNFYEYRVLLKPGWDLGNFVEMDFNRLTNLKSVRTERNKQSGSTADTISDGGNLFVKGNPSLAAVRWYVMGIENLDSTRAASGEVWTDELLLTDVRRETGTAGRFHLSTQLADLGTVNFEASRQGATFRNLTGSESGTLSYNRSAATTELLSFSGSFQGHRFLPKFLGFSALPISINWSRSRSTPRLRTGSDIILTDEFAEAERSEQIRRGFSVTPSLRKETKNKLWNLTFNRMNGSFSYSYYRGSDPFTRLSEQRSYTASLAYDLSPKKTLGFKPLGWLPSFWLLKKVGGTQFSPLPATFNVSGDVSRTLSTTILNDAFQRPTVSYIRDFRGRMTAGFRIFPNLSADYSFNTRRDISNPENLAFSFSPKKFKLGVEVERRQDFRTSYNPGLFSFADTRLNFSSTYSEALVVGLGALAGTRRIEGSSGYGANVNFNLTRLLGQPKAPSPAEVARRTAEREKKEAERKAKEEEKKRAERWPLDSARIADSLARAAAEARRREVASWDTIPAEIRFRESLNRFVPLPVPAFGFILPRLGPAKKDTASVPAPTPPTPVAPGGVAKLPGDTTMRAAPDGARPGFALGDSAKKPVPPPVAKEKGSGKVFLLSDGLNFVRKLADRVEPVQFTYNHTNNISRQGLRNRPGLDFQFGLVTDPGEVGVSSSSNSEREADNYTAGTGLNLGSGIRVNGRYAKNITQGRISTGSSRQEAETFPDMTVSLSGLERRVGFLKKILPAGTISSNYQKQTTTSFDTRTGQALSQGIAKNHNPLVSVSATFFRGLSANFSYRKSLQEMKTRPEGTSVFNTSQNTENGFMLSTRYSFIAPRGIRLPLLRGIRLSSSLNTNLSIQYSHRVSRNLNPTPGTSGITTDMTTLSINPSFTYSFSTQVDGGFSLQWTDQKNNIDKKTNKIRTATFTVDLKF